VTISSATRKAGPFLGNGVTNSFPFTFKVFSTSDLQVIKTSVAGVDSVLVLNSDYSISLNVDQNNSPGGTITYPTSGALLQTGEKLTATGVLSDLQGTHITNGGNFFANNIEDQMDYLTILVQQHSEKLARAMIGSTSDATPNMTLGTALQRALKYPVFDASGNVSLAQVLPSGTLSQATILSFLAGAASGIGAILYPASSAENTASVVPTDLRYPYGAFRRYGMDPTGVADSATAFANACKCNALVYDDFPNGGTYLFNSQVNVSAYPLRIQGATKGKLGTPTGGSGTTFVLAAAAGASAALIRFSSFSDIEISGLRVLLNASAGSLSQKGFRFGELRSSRIEKCSFFGPGISTDDTTAIQFDGGGTFTGDVDVDRCYFSNHQQGIQIGSAAGDLTTVRVLNCEFYGTAGHATSIGVNVASGTAGVLIMGCTFNVWHRGIFSTGKYLKQIGNYFEDANPQFEWSTSVNAVLHNQSFGDTFLGIGTPIYPRTDAAVCQVYGILDAFTAGQALTATRGFNELRAFNLGYFTTPTFSAGNFTASGAMTWTVVGGGVTTYAYTVVGKMMTVIFAISGTVAGTPNTALQIAIPGGFTSAQFALNSCSALSGGTWKASACQVTAAGTVIQIFTDPAGATNWTAGAVNVSGQISFPVN
jgi:hypothetical protein